MMRKPLHSNINSNMQSKPHFIPQRQTKLHHKKTQKTISELKQSLGSIEKMIEKSQEILWSTRPLNPREIRSDSLQLKLKNDSREKSQRKRKFDMNIELEKLSATEGISHIENKAWNTQNHLERTNMSARSQFPFKNKSGRGHLFIDTENFEKSQGDRSSFKQNIFISDAMSPVSAITRQREGFQESFSDSLEIPFNFGRRLRTEMINDSYQRSLEGQSLERYNSVQRQSDFPTRQENPTKKIILRKKKYYPNVEDHHYQTEKKQTFQRGKRQRIFQLRPTQREQGKFAHFLTNHQVLKNEPKSRVEKKANPQDFSYRLVTESRRVPSNAKFNKENQSLTLGEFYKKVKQFGFVERYLTHNQIMNIFQYLQKSSIPQHKWPLYVVDKVYQKMQILPKSKS